MKLASELHKRRLELLYSWMNDDRGFIQTRSLAQGFSSFLRRRWHYWVLVITQSDDGKTISSIWDLMVSVVEPSLQIGTQKKCASHTGHYLKGKYITNKRVQSIG